MAILRDPSGHFYSDGKPLTEEEKAKLPFKKGQTYKKVCTHTFHGEVKALLKEASPAAARRLIELVNSDNERIALQAATAILDRVFGKPTVAVQVEQSNDVSLSTRSLIRSLIIEREGEKGIRSIGESIDKAPPIKSNIPAASSQLPETPKKMYTSRHKYDPELLKPAAVDLTDRLYDVEQTRDCTKVMPAGTREKAKKLIKPIELANVDGVLSIIS